MASRPDQVFTECQASKRCSSAPSWAKSESDARSRPPVSSNTSTGSERSGGLDGSKQRSVQVPRFTYNPSPPALLLQRVDRGVAGPFPQPILPLRRGADTVDANESCEPSGRCRQLAVDGKESQEGAEEAAERLRVEPAFEDGDHRLLRPQRDDPPCVHAHIPL